MPSFVDLDHHKIWVLVEACKSPKNESLPFGVVATILLISSFRTAGYGQGPEYIYIYKYDVSN